MREEERERKREKRGVQKGKGKRNERKKKMDIKKSGDFLRKEEERRMTKAG